MQVQFNQTVDDIVAVNLFHMKHSLTMRRMKRIATLVIVCLFLWFGLLRRYDWAFFVVAVLFFYIVFIRIVPKRYIRKLVREGRNTGLFGPCTVTISPEGISKKTEFSQSSFTWSSVERIDTTDDYALVYVNSLSALIVPRRAFGTPSEFAAFVSQAQQYIDTARQSSLSVAGGALDRAVAADSDE